jgi:DNA-binding MarR family transcriptional regulator
MLRLTNKEKELMDYLDSIVHRIMLGQEQFVCMCSKRELRIVDILGKKGPSMMTELAEQAMLSLSTVTGIVDGLVEKSLVRRERSEEDRRVVRVELTEEGTKMHQQSLEFRMKLVHSMLTSLNRNEQDAFIDLFRKIAHRVQVDTRRTIA